MVAVFSDQFHSFIDEPSSANLTATRVAIRGWCYHRGGASIMAVRARIGFSVYVGIYGIPRPDVEAAYGDPGGRTSGFEIAVTLPVSACTVLLEAKVADTWHGFRDFRVGPRRGALLGERWRWGRLWAKAWLGWPIWRALRAEERRFLLAWARQRNLLTIGVWNQYPPREISHERFPKPRLAASSLPKVSIVPPSFNQKKFLEQAMLSVLEQTGVRIEYVVQDGGSTDGSVALIQRHAGRLKGWASAADGGQAAAVQQGFRKMESAPDDIMAYLNSDDVLVAGAVRFVAEYFARHPAIDVVYGHRILIDANGLEVGRWITPRRRCDDLRMHDFVPQETLFWRKRIWDRVGGIAPEFQFALDWDLLLRFQDAGAKFARLPWFLGCFRLHPDQKTQTWIDKVGKFESDGLRARNFAASPATDELLIAMEQAQFDSALVYTLLKKGVRV